MFGSRSARVASVLLSLLIAAPAAVSAQGGCEASSCVLKYEGLWTSVSVGLPGCSSTDAQELIGQVQYYIGSAPTKWTATDDGSGGSDVSFNIPLQADPDDMNQVLGSLNMFNTGICVNG